MKKTPKQEIDALRKAGITVLDRRFTPMSKCQDCGAFEETRPYGPGGKEVCFDCMMKDEDEAKRQFQKVLDRGGN